MAVQRDTEKAGTVKPGRGLYGELPIGLKCTGNPNGKILCIVDTEVGKVPCDDEDCPVCSKE